MLNNRELDVVRQAIPYVVVGDSKLAAELNLLIEKYEKVREKLSNKVSISDADLRAKRIEGLSKSQCAKFFNCSTATIQRLLTLYKLGGIGGKQEFNYATKKNQK